MTDPTPPALAPLITMGEDYYKGVGGLRPGANELRHEIDAQRAEVARLQQALTKAEEAIAAHVLCCCLSDVRELRARVTTLETALRQIAKVVDGRGSVYVQIDEIDVLVHDALTKESR